MTRTLSMGSHKNHNLSANEGFVISLTSKLITCFIGGFALTIKPQSIVHYSMEMNMSNGFGTLRAKCTHMGFVGTWPSRMQEQWLFFKIGRTGINFSRVQEKLIFWTGGYLCPILTLRKVRGGTLLSPIDEGAHCISQLSLYNHWRRRRRRPTALHIFSKGCCGSDGTWRG